MLSQETLQGNWNEVKGKIKHRWGELTDSQLDQAHGSIDQLVGTIQQNTGATREEVERYLNEMSAATDSRMRRASESARAYAHAATDEMERQSQLALESMRAGYEQTQQLIKRRPVESLMTCFGVGVVTGVVVGLLLRSK